MSMTMGREYGTMRYAADDMSVGRSALAKAVSLFSLLETRLRQSYQFIPIRQ